MATVHCYVPNTTNENINTVVMKQVSIKKGLSSKFIVNSK